MALDLVRRTLKYTIFLGLIGIFIAWAFNLQMTFVDRQTINGMQILTFNWYRYIASINNAWDANALQFEDILPTREWLITNASLIQAEFWNTLINDMACIFDWLYFPINFIAYILRWITWVIRLGLALIGWDFTMVEGQYNSILIRVLTWITQNLVIPYI